MQQKKYRITGVLVYLEGRWTRKFVGTLTRTEANQFRFDYDAHYLRAPNVVSLGPEMPLTRPRYESATLFIPFMDRLPSRENPAYADYCFATGIDQNETDPFILLTTVAHRGPSSFIFEALYEDVFSAEDLLSFRKTLGLSVKEFAACFDFSTAAVTRVERKLSSGRELLKRAEIYAQFPQVALDQMRKRAGILHTDKQRRVENYLKSMV